METAKSIQKSLLYFYSIYLQKNSSTIKQGKVKVKAIFFPSSQEMCDPKIAMQYKVKGCIQVSLASNISKAGNLSLYIKSGEKGAIPIILHFVSYTPELNEVKVTLNPRGIAYELEIISHSFIHVCNLLLSNFAKPKIF
jgi:hypothetical protein